MYASTKSSGCTTDAPIALAGYGAMGESIPKRWASAMTESAPARSQSCTATGLRERVDRFAQRDVAEEVAVVVFRPIHLPVVRDVERRVRHDRIRRHGIHDRARVDNRLEARPRLAHAADRAVERGVLILAPSDECAHVAGWSVRWRRSRPAGSRMIALHALVVGRSCDSSGRCSTAVAPSARASTAARWSAGSSPV